MWKFSIVQKLGYTCCKEIMLYDTQETFATQLPFQTAHLIWITHNIHDNHSLDLQKTEQGSKREKNLQHGQMFCTNVCCEQWLEVCVWIGAHVIPSLLPCHWLLLIDMSSFSYTNTSPCTLSQLEPAVSICLFCWGSLLFTFTKWIPSKNPSLFKPASIWPLSAIDLFQCLVEYRH